MKCFLFPYWVQKNNLFWDNETKQKPLYLLIPPTSKKLTPVYVHQIQFWVGTLPSIMRVLVAVSVWGKTSCSYHKENKMSWKQFKFLNGQLTNHRWGRALDLGGRYCFDRSLRSTHEDNPHALCQLLSQSCNFKHKDENLHLVIKIIYHCSNTNQFK